MSKEVDFNFFIPATLVKAKGKDGKTKMILKGIASTSAQDSQGETLDPNGFDLSYFKKHGYVNWNHQTGKDPLSLIGRPTSNTTISKGQMLIEAELFGNNPRAVDAYKTQEILAANGLALGWSIEGKATERGALKKGDPGWNQVKKARITGVALTPNPINQQTVAEIVKAHEFNLPLSGYSNKSEEEQDQAIKGMSTESARAVIPESVDKNVKDTQNFTKGEFYKHLFGDFPLLDMDSADRIYTLATSIEKSINPIIMEKNNENTVTEEALEKAYATLGLSKGEVVVVEENVEDLDLEKSELHDEVLKASISVLEKQGYVIQKGESVDNDSEEEESEEEEENEKESSVEKGTLSQLIKSEVSSLKKDNDIKSKAVGTLIKGFESTLQELTQKMSILEQESPGIKSIQSQSFLEKSEPGGQLNNDSGKKTLSLSQNKSDIMTIADGLSGLSKGEITDSALADSTCMYESSSYADETLIKALTGEGYTIMK